MDALFWNHVCGLSQLWDKGLVYKALSHAVQLAALHSLIDFEANSTTVMCKTQRSKYALVDEPPQACSYGQQPPGHFLESRDRRRRGGHLCQVKREDGHHFVLAVERASVLGKDLDIVEQFSGATLVARDITHLHNCQITPMRSK